MGFAYAKQEVAYEIVAPAGTSLALVDLALSLFKDQKWLQRPAGVKAPIVAAKGGRIHLVAAVKRAPKTAPAPYELTMRATAALRVKTPTAGVHRGLVAHPHSPGRPSRASRRR